MLTYISDDTRPQVQLFDRVLTSVNPSNVKLRRTAKVVEPFQPPSVFPLGRPPLRYPDVMTMPGFMSDPRLDETAFRNVMGQLAGTEPGVNAANVGLEPTFHDPGAYQGDKGRNGPTVLEQLERALHPTVQSRPANSEF
jgi:hypothetical protein